MNVERITIPLAQPFEQTLVNDHVRVDAEQSYEAARHARAAAQEVEQYGQLALLTQTIRVTLDSWPDCGWLSLPIAPMIEGSVIAITVADVAVNNYSIRYGLRPAIKLIDPIPTGEVVIEYDAGWGDEPTSIPADLSHAIMDQAAVFFDMRGAGDGKSNGMSPHTARVVARYRRVAL